MNSHIVAQQDFFDLILDNISSAVLIVDKEFRVFYVNDIYKKIFKKNELEEYNQLCGNAIGCFFSVTEEKPCGTTSKCKTCAIRGCLVRSLSENQASHTTYIIRKFFIQDLELLKYFRIRAQALLYRKEEIIVISIDDITEFEEKKKKLEDRANLDCLTGLYNRRFLEEKGPELFSNYISSDSSLAAVLIDIDYFKTVNDYFGHDAGDRVLKEFSHTLKKSLRQEDIIIRYGGEEFLVLLAINAPKEAFIIIEKIRKKIGSKIFKYNDYNISITISAGICVSTGNSLFEMITVADTLLYSAKKAGRNRTIQEEV